MPSKGGGAGVAAFRVEPANVLMQREIRGLFLGWHGDC